MPDPTETIIIATFSAAFGIFVLAFIARKLFGKSQSEPVVEPVADAAYPWIGHLDRGAGHFPYDSPEVLDHLPEPPDEPLPTWFYRPLDLLGIGFVFMLFFSLVLASVRAAKDDMVLDVPGLLASIAFQYVCAGIVTAFVITRIRPVKWLGLKWSSWPWIFLIAPCTVLTMWLLFGSLQYSGYMEWIQSLGVETVQDTVKLLQESEDPMILGLMIFAAVVAAPMCEEIVFRGYLYPAVKSFIGPWAAAICTALVFAAAHGSLAALLPLVIFGCVLVILYEKTGSLWAPIGVHMCFNGATVLVQLAARFYELPIDATP